MKNELSNENKYSNRILTIPNVLSFFRLCLIPLIVWMYCIRKMYPETGYLLILSGATDIVDGFIARKFGMVSNFGKILDPVADKLTQGAMLICLLTRFPMMLMPLTLMLLKEIYMGITGCLVIHRTGKVLGANWHGKAATVLLYGMMILHVLWADIPTTASSLSITVCMTMMVISMVLYDRRNLAAMKGAQK